jgi:hypothetical protein
MLDLPFHDNALIRHRVLCSLLLSRLGYGTGRASSPLPMDETFYFLSNLDEKGIFQTKVSQKNSLPLLSWMWA